MAEEIKPELNPNSLVPNQPALIQPNQAVNTNNSPDFDDVALGGISMRGLLTFILIGAVVVLTGFGQIKPDTLVALALTSFGFYFGGKK